LKILVGIKHVPHTETKVRIGGDGRSLDPAAVTKWILSTYDEYAVEQALQFREAHGGEVVLVCCGPEAALSALRQGLAMGADRGILVQHDGFDASDGLTRARALAAVAGQDSFDLVLCGKYGVGTDEGQTGPMLAELLGWPHAAGVTTLELEDGAFRAAREVEGAVESYEGRLPAVITCDKGLNEPRLTSLKGIMQAKRKPVDVKAPADLGLDPAALEPGGRMLVWESMELPPPRAGGRLIEGSPEESASELVRLLREEAKVI